MAGVESAAAVLVSLLGGGIVVKVIDVVVSSRRAAREAAAAAEREAREDDSETERAAIVDRASFMTALVERLEIIEKRHEDCMRENRGLVTELERARARVEQLTEDVGELRARVTAAEAHAEQSDQRAAALATELRELRQALR